MPINTFNHNLQRKKYRGLIKFQELKKEILTRLKQELPAHLVYHSVEHTQYVVDKAIFIASKENVKGKKLQLLKLAALYHDTGFLIEAKDHELHSCSIARKGLKNHFSATDLEVICGMIMATKIPQNPQNHLERILADADLEYLGTTNFDETSELLYQELLHGNPNLSRDKWNEIQISFIGAHKYHTRFCQQYREKYKQKHLEKLKR